MRIIKCDICRKTIEKDLKSKNIRIEIGLFDDSFEICEKCGKPIVDLLKDKKLIKIENKKHGRK